MKVQIAKGTSTTQPYFWRNVAFNGKTLAVSENYVAKASGHERRRVRDHARGRRDCRRPHRAPGGR